MTKADTVVWATMRQDLWETQSFDEHRADIKRILKSKGTQAAFLAAVDHVEPVGFAELSIREYANGCTRQPVPFLEGIWVKPSWRRQGGGRKLLARIERVLLAQGFGELCSDAEITNSLSHRAHAGWGFAETERVIYFRKGLARPQD